MTLSRSKSKFLNILQAIYCVLFSCTLVSIPVCSFNTKYLIITWIFAIFLALSMSLIFFFKGKIVFHLPLILSYAFLIIAMLVSSLINMNGAFSYTPFILIGVIVFAFVFYSTFTQIRNISYYLVYVSLVIFLAIFIFIYKDNLISMDFYRLGDIFGDQNEIAMFMSLGTCFSLFFILKKKNIWIKIFISILLILFVYCGFSTGSKLFLFTCLGCFLFLLFSVFRKRIWIALAVLIGFAVLGIVLLNLPAFSSYKDRILGFFNFFSPKPSEDADFSTYERLQMFLAGLQMFTTKPIFGFGTLGFSQLSSFEKGCHNTIAQILCNYGLVGGFFFFYPFAKSFIVFQKGEKKDNHILALMIILFFVMTMFSLYLDIQKIYAFIIPIAYSELLCSDNKNTYEFKNPFYAKTLFAKRKTRAPLDKKNRICFVISNFGLGGPQELVKNISSSLNTNLFEISIIVMFDVINEKYNEYINSQKDITFYILDKKKGKLSFSFILRMKELFDKIDADIFSTHTSALPYVALLNKFNRKPIVHTIHTIPNLDQSKLVRFFIKKQIKRKQIRFIACSKTISQLASKLYKIDVEYINNGVFINDNSIKLKNEHKYTFFTLGRLVSMKRIEFIIKSFSLINSDQKYNLAIVGDGPEKQKLQRYVCENNITNIDFLGEISNVNDFLSSAHIHLMASEWEANPMSILEAMNYGIPSICTNVGGVSDSILHDYNGFLFEKNNMDELIFYMKKLLDEGEYRRMSLNCLHKIKEFDIELTTEAYQKVFLEEVNKNG